MGQLITASEARGMTEWIKNDLCGTEEMIRHTLQLAATVEELWEYVRLWGDERCWNLGTWCVDGGRASGRCAEARPESSLCPPCQANKLLAATKAATVAAVRTALLERFITLPSATSDRSLPARSR